MVSTKVQEKVQAETARNYVGQNLRGRSFKGQDLAGADFSGADIRGARFVDANLVGARFVGTKAGVQKRWLLGQLCLIFAFTFFLNAFSVIFNAAAFTYLFETSTIQEITVFPGLVAVLVEFFCFYAIGRQGLTPKALNTVLIAIVVAMISVLAVAGSDVVTVAGAGAGAGAFAFAFAFIFAFIFAAASVGGATGFFVALAGSFAGTTVAVGESLLGTIAVTLSLAEMGAAFLLAFHITYRVKQGDKAFALAHNIGMYFSILGGTSFAGTNLTNADFSQAVLTASNFNRSRQREAVLKHVFWDDSKQLNKARIEQSILADSRVQQLLVQRIGPSKSYQNADLHEANLNGIYLEKAQLHRANLNRATCRDADFSQAILTEAQAIGTDFTNANLTGACLENWNIDQTTIFEGVRCDYIFLREHPDERGSRERRPHNPDKNFEPGDFQKYFQEVLDNLQLLIRNGTSPEALRAAMLELEQQHGITSNDITKTERKGDDLMLTFEPQHRVDKAAVEASFDSAIAQQIAAAAEEKGRLKGRIESLERENQSLKQDKQTASEALHLALARPISVNVNQNQNNSVVSETNNLTQNNSGGTNFQTKASDSELNQGETLNIDSASKPPESSS